MDTLRDFLQSSFEARCDWVINQGDYLATREMESVKIYLYASAGFFMEVYYSPAHKQVLMVHAFDGLGGLEPYLDLISIAELNLPVM